MARTPQLDKDSKNAVPTECFWHALKRTDAEGFEGRRTPKQKPCMDPGAWLTELPQVKGQDHCPRSL